MVFNVQTTGSISGYAMGILKLAISSVLSCTLF
jgi:hypothetical protein